MLQVQMDTDNVNLLPGELIMIGRGDNCDIQLDDPSASRVHCRLLNRDGKVFLTDAGSRWGTFVNGGRVTECELSIGDEFTVGETVLRISAEGHAAATTLVPPRGAQHGLPVEEFVSPKKARFSEGGEFLAIMLKRCSRTHIPG